MILNEGRNVKKKKKKEFSLHVPPGIGGRKEGRKKGRKHAAALPPGGHYRIPHHTETRNRQLLLIFFFFFFFFKMMSPIITPYLIRFCASLSRVSFSSELKMIAVSMKGQAAIKLTSPAPHWHREDSLTVRCPLTL